MGLRKVDPLVKCIMSVFGLILLSTTTLCAEVHDPQLNVTGPKDMYVVRATVYQVGILTNRTNDTSGSNAGHEEAITFYHNNGSSIDLSAIPEPVLTNVTAEKVIGVAPANSNTVPWSALRHLVSSQNPQGKSSGAVAMDTEAHNIEKRETPNKPVQVVKSTAVIPSEAGVQSIALPPLLTLNKNLSKIPVPIPNMSVVSYTKVNTVAQSPSN